MRAVYIVQTLDSGEFLRPGQDGDISYSHLFRDAGHFENYEAAFETAIEQVGELFYVSKFYVEGKEH